MTSGLTIATATVQAILGRCKSEYIHIKNPRINSTHYCQVYIWPFVISSPPSLLFQEYK